MSAKRFGCILFDLDGTLVDSLADIASAVNDLRADEGLCALPQSEVRAAIGDGAWFLLRRTFPEGAFSEALLARFLTRYEVRLTEQTRLYPGIGELLETLAHRQIAIVTNKPEGLTRSLLDALNLSRYFDLVLGAESCSEKKPHPLPLLTAMERLGADPSTTLMVGDHHTDLHAGAAAGVRTCFCAYGLGERGDAPADYEVRSPAELFRLLNGAA